MMQEGQYETSQGTGRIVLGPDLRFDELGRARYELRIVLDHVDEPMQLQRQARAGSVAFTFDTKETLLPLFGGGENAGG